MADADSQLRSARAFADRHAQVSGIPGFDGVPGEELTILQADFPFRIDDNGGVIGILVGVRVPFHNGKYTVHSFFFAGFGKGISLFPRNITEEFIGEPLRCIQALGAVFRENNEFRSRIPGLRGMEGPYDFMDLSVNVRPAVDDGHRHLDGCDEKTMAWLIDTSDTAHKYLPREEIPSQTK
jgi:hypothetical protein